MQQGKRETIAVNQLGYRVKDSKIAVITGEAGLFRLIKQETGEVVWKGRTTAAREDAASGVTVCRADFSGWEQAGTYSLETENGQRSDSFVIGEEVYGDAHQALLKAFYFFRCGMELEERYAGDWKHGACHLSPAIVYGDEKRRVDASGGWHDAGDYGKYVGPGAKAAADLLLAYEWYPAAFAAAVPVPESDGVMPDVLHECRYELEWMQRMQDAESGGVFHKLTTLRFPAPDTMPEADADELYVSPVSATATGCFAGIMAMAARVYERFDRVFAATCKAAAERAWDWLELHPEAPGFRNPPEIATGEYGDKQDADERYWAAAELYRTTGEERYHEAFLRLSELAFDKYELGWADMGGYGTISYLLSERAKDSAVAERLRVGLHRHAEQLAAVSRNDGFGISLRPEQYIWGSNMLVLNHAMLLLIADRLAETAGYEKVVLDHIHYLFGMNVIGMSYVTGFGSRPVKHPHHRPSEGDGVDEPVPGLVSGGPNLGIQDEYAREHLTGRAPAASFADVMESYATNEVTIYWNSPAVFVLSHFV
ncbi:glycoside hydrolase family 9 protein [Paenibacillus glycanilyticus]|uniref:glycoside hydrolase family 9 protein n=1 Tax=Paenibacillus glycanilyticus TaxID=126569 RepID=UPI00203D291A|nr:glycoside hydrolase family 9 protein [Paenibacillus glycanilyticus]MCM3629051.1 glycoside hydrolase family 9 protein [Paenibacillus glycanilyticus]